MPIHLSNRAGTTYASRRKQQQQQTRLHVYEDPPSSSEEGAEKEAKGSRTTEKKKPASRPAFGVKDANASLLPRVHAQHPVVKERPETDRKGKKPIKEQAVTQESVGKENVSPLKVEQNAAQRKQVRRGASSEKTISAITGPVTKNKQVSQLLADAPAQHWTPTTKRTRRPRREAASRGIDYCELDSPLQSRDNKKKEKDKEEESLSFSLEQLKLEEEETDSDASAEEHSEVSLVVGSPRHSKRLSRRGPRKYGARSAATRRVLADISLEVNDIENQTQSESSVDSYSQLLVACGQKKAKGFDRCIGELLKKPLEEAEPIGSSAGPVNTISKIGEASFSEVYRILSHAEASESPATSSASIVLKVIPLRSLDPWAYLGKNERGESLPSTSTAEDALRELQITKAVASVGSKVNPMGESNGFVKLCDAYVVEGKYAQVLLDRWDEFDEAVEQGSENRTPSRFESQQKYLILALSYGGVDLEHTKLANWQQAASVFWQVVLSLSVAEQESQFEHRDLHWGNVLVQTEEKHDRLSESTFTLETLAQPRATGIRATIIDFTLSRVNALEGQQLAAGIDGVLYDKMAGDELFEGHGDIQFDVYRQMREVTKGEWQIFEPATNLLWLRYLVTKLLEDKGLKAPPKRKLAKSGPAVAIERLAYENLCRTREKLEKLSEGKVDVDDHGLRGALDLWKAMASQA